ncbi:cobalamin biosynthesis protein [Actinomarinicola tropica]|uniref:Cobalamin biosynthesis protein CobD n=1 Tax=Actinomarinicola tropica TaxID=2789776 RepID=A0A5Q2RJL4_9ACTN|nr:cobalamin biosynthesis protein [Actinomarinicola tropica]
MGLLADGVVRHPSWVPHPLSLFGTAMGRLERRLHADDVGAGARYTAAGVALGAAAAVPLRSTILATWLATGGHQLHEVAIDVADRLEDDDLDGARDLLPSLVGRDPAALDTSGVARAVVESVAENTVDAVVAPAMWAAAAGPTGVLVHRAVDTMDSMVGYRTERYERFGRVAARLDDAMAWVPARATALLVAAARPDAARAVLRAVRRDAPAHPSPNAGVAEAAFAAALGLQLGGPTPYPGGRVEDRPLLGSGRAPAAADIRAAVELSADVTTALATALAGYGLARLGR